MKKEKFFLLILVFAFIDQLTKLFVILFKDKLPIVLIKNVLEITYCENRGIAFGMGAGATVTITIITALIMIMILALINKNYNKIDKKLLFGGVLLISGGIGNFLDRVFRFYVVDFIYFKPIDFPVFNFADICIVIGVFIVGTRFLLMDRGEKSEGNNSNK